MPGLSRPAAGADVGSLAPARGAVGDAGAAPTVPRDDAAAGLRDGAAAGPLVVLATDTLPPHEAAAWRLAGAQLHLCPADRAVGALPAARAQAALLLLDGALAAALPAPVLEAALTGLPLTVVLPGSATRALEPDERVRAQLGVDPQVLA